MPSKCGRGIAGQHYGRSVCMRWFAVVLKLRVWVLVLGLVPFGSSILVTSTAQAVPVHNAEPTANRGYIQFGLTPAPRKARPRKERVRGTVAPSSVPADVLCEAVGSTISTAPVVEDVGRSPRAGRKTAKTTQHTAASVSRKPPRRGRGVVQLAPSVTPPVVQPCIGGGVNDGSEPDETGTEPSDPLLTDLADTEFAILLSSDSHSRRRPSLQPANL